MPQLQKFVVAVALVAVMSTAAGAQEKDQSSSKRSEFAAATATPNIPTESALSAAEQGIYTIGEQDVLSIRVWKEPDLSVDATVRPDGKITMPLLNDVAVTGLTPTQLQQALTEKLQAYLKAAQVTVIVKEVNSRKVYLVGQVNRPGTFKISSATTVLQLLSEAGGLREFARSKDIYVLRKQAGKEIRLPFNYHDVLRAKKNAQDVVLKPGDTIIVP